MVDPKMFKFGNIQHVIAPRAVRINDAVWDNLGAIIGYNGADEASAITFV